MMTHLQRRGFRCSAAAILLAALFGGCNLNDAISVDPADRVTEDVLNDPQQASTLVASVQALFECAYGGYIMGLGYIGGEVNSLGDTGTFGYDRRAVTSAGGGGDCTGIGTYTPLSSTRWFADETVKRLEGWTDQQVANRQLLIATTAVYAGYALVFLGEGHCSIAIDQGPEIQSAQVFPVAEQRFDKAIAAAQLAGGAGGTDIVNMARVGRARARINAGKTAEAVADAQLVPLNYVKNATYAAGNGFRENRPFVSINRGNGAGLSPNYWDVRWAGVPDPRVRVRDEGNNTVGVRRFTQQMYPTDASPIPLATWEEAQLIIAEVQGGQAAINIINALHTKYQLPPFAGGDAAAIRAQVIEERRRQFFLQGHRSYDIIRFNLTQDPPVGSPYRWGGVHGATKCLPLPDAERDTNPNI